MNSPVSMTVFCSLGVILPGGRGVRSYVRCKLLKKNHSVQIEITWPTLIAGTKISYTSRRPTDDTESLASSGTVKSRPRVRNIHYFPFSAVLLCQRGPSYKEYATHFRTHQQKYPTTGSGRSHTRTVVQVSGKSFVTVQHSPA